VIEEASGTSSGTILLIEAVTTRMSFVARSVGCRPSRCHFELVEGSGNKAALLVVNRKRQEVAWTDERDSLDARRQRIDVHRA